MMTSKDHLRWYLDKAISSRVASLEKRIHINAGMRISLNRKDLHLSPSSSEFCSLKESLVQHYRNIDQIIIECNESIVKMQLLRSMLYTIDVQKLLHLFINTSNYSYKDLQDFLQNHRSSQQNELKDHLMVA
jgi:hypothetical protein